MSLHPIRATPTNAMTVDAEEWFQVQNYAHTIPRDSWERLESRVEATTDRLLGLFAGCGVRATFFTLGWIAERHPRLIRRIVAGGHELASHGHGHEQVFAIGPARFRADIRRAKAALEDAGGVPVAGYRAPTFSLTPTRTPWAYDILAEEGHRYSSSVFPGRHAGTADDALCPSVQAGGVVELPLTALRAAGRCLPLAGGGWFRVTPQALFVAALRRVNAQGRNGVFYLHPWEIDPDQPRMPGMGWLQRRRHFTGLGTMATRLAALLDPAQGFAWGRMDEVFAPALACPPTRVAA
jgi:polysaccharide deacetylase family protein (PEP-CTERM system associated)